MESFGGKGFVDRRRPTDEDRKLARQGLARAFAVVEEGNTDLLIRDEINVAIACGLLSVEDALNLLQGKPPSLGIILTGREAHTLMIECADLVTEMRRVEHPSEKGDESPQGDRVLSVAIA